MRGLDAETGSENSLQDYTAAHNFYEKAIALGCIRAYTFLAYLYIGGNGVRQSSEMAFKILKAGGDKGDSRCYKIMWDIYAGQTVLEARHESNAEVCFQWFLDAAKEGVESTDLSDYLYHSYEKLGGDVTTWGIKRYPINMFPGKFVATVIEMWSERVKLVFRQIKDARLAGTPFDQIENQRSPDAASIADVILFPSFLSDCVQHHHDLMKRAMEEVTREDLEYCFSKAKNVKQTVDEYIPYISMQPTFTLLAKDIAGISQRTPGFFSRLFSR